MIEIKNTLLITTQKVPFGDLGAYFPLGDLGASTFPKGRLFIKT